jgi:ATP-dependent DNA helicase RecQ
MLLKLACNDERLSFRPGQWEAIDRLVNHRRRVLVVQRTGWGKSLVYFLSAKFFRDQGAGPTLVVSPLLALVRNQLEAAARVGLRPATVNSANRADWEAVRAELLADRVDLLLISPERLANDDFVAEFLAPVAERVALLVVDEAHCISDWGHDFRPDYRRIVQIVRRLPNVAVLATTATANRRVVADVADLISAMETQRGTLARESLRLQTLRLPDAAARLAWLADHIAELRGSGIVYTLTVRDAKRVAEWLEGRGFVTGAYYSGALGEGYEDSNLYRENLERRLIENDVKCLVATTALGMGFDKPDLGFVIHYQAPGSVILYYQQVGRAGRALPEALGLLMCGEEDGDINRYFRESAFPPGWQVDRILAALAESENGLSVQQLEGDVNLRRGQIEKVLKILSVDDEPPVVREKARWYLTPRQYRPDRERIQRLTRQREDEWAQMQDYAAARTCLMAFLARALDDDEARSCGMCAVCVAAPVVPATYRQETLLEAQRFLSRSEMTLNPRQRFPPGALPQYGWGGGIPVALRAQPGRVMGHWGESGWGERVRLGKDAGTFSDRLVAGTAEMIRGRWPEAADLRWVACVPSLRHPRLVPDLAERLAHALGLPFRSVVTKVRETAPQKEMQNAPHQCRNLDGAFAIERAGADLSGSVLLVDDVTDSRWTLTVVAALLRREGSGPVFPLALADASTD